MESLAEHYYNLLVESKNPVPVLVSFYRELFDIKDISSDVYAKFARLHRIYGTELVYFSLLDCTEVTDLDTSSVPTRLISFFAKKRIKDKISDRRLMDLTFMVEKREKELSKKRRIKIPTDPFAEAE